MGNPLSRQYWGVIHNDTKFDIFFAIHSKDVECPFLQITEEVKANKTREQLKAIIAAIYGVHQIPSKDYCASGLDTLKLNGQQRLSIVFQNGDFIQRSLKINTVDDIRLKITSDLLVRHFHQEQANKLKSLATASRILQHPSICYDCLQNQVQSAAIPLRLNSDNDCFQCKRKIKEAKFWVCKAFPVTHNFCDECQKKKSVLKKKYSKKQQLPLNPEVIKPDNIKHLQQKQLMKQNPKYYAQQDVKQYAKQQPRQPIDSILSLNWSMAKRRDPTQTLILDDMEMVQENKYQSSDLQNGLKVHDQSKIMISGLQGYY